MSAPRLRHALWALVILPIVILAGCGGGSIESPFQPTRLVAFGDGVGDVGQGGLRARYTINGAGAPNIWSLQVADVLGLELEPQASGGTGYATGNARVQGQPDAAGSNATPTLKDQVDTFLAAGSPRAGDLILVSAGTADIIYEAINAADTATARENLAQAGRQLAVQVRRLLDAGATHVLVLGPYNLGTTPWAVQSTDATLASKLAGLSRAFDVAVLGGLDQLGAKVLYVEGIRAVDRVIAVPSLYGLTNVTGHACTSRDAGAGIGIGTGEVNSSLCTAATVRAGIDEKTWLFADGVYLSAVGHRLLGDYVLEKLRSRW